MASSISCQVHVDKDTRIKVRMLSGGGAPFTSIPVGDCSLLISNMADVRRLADALNAYLADADLQVVA